MESINFHHLLLIQLDQQWINYQPKSDQMRNTKLIDHNWMEKVLIFSNG